KIHRGHNEGSIYKRKDGRWVGAIFLGYQAGKLKRKLIYGKSRAEVSEQLTKSLRDHQQGLLVSTDRQTVSEFLNHWLDHSAKQTVRVRTLKDYDEIVKLHLNPRIGDQRLQKLTPQHVQKMMNDLSQSGLGPRRVIYCRSVLRIALNRAIKWGLVTRNVAALS